MKTVARQKQVRAEKLSHGKHIIKYYFKKTWKGLVLQNSQMKEVIRNKETLFTRETEQSINWRQLNVKPE